LSRFIKAGSAFTAAMNELNLSEGMGPKADKFIVLRAE
jgi:hypothetical protein